MTDPVSDGLICHVVNDSKVMGAGVALAISKKWWKVKNDYLKWNDEQFELGNVQVVWVGENLAVVNMLAQCGLRSYNQQNPPIRYEALRECFKNVRTVAIRENLPVHLPYKIGCGLAGGNWNIVSEIIKKELSERDVKVFVYDFKSE